jgi:Family of unknown function (DUF6221)
MEATADVNRTEHVRPNYTGTIPDGFRRSNALRDLADFLLARIEEEEQRTRSVIETTRHTRSLGGVMVRWKWTLLTRPPGRDGGWSSELYDGVPSPGRVLDDFNARRRIVAESRRHDAGHDEVTGGYHRVLRLLALPYAEHPQYRDAWQP